MHAYYVYIQYNANKENRVQTREHFAAECQATNDLNWYLSIPRDDWHSHDQSSVHFLMNPKYYIVEHQYVLSVNS